MDDQSKIVFDEVFEKAVTDFPFKPSRGSVVGQNKLNNTAGQFFVSRNGQKYSVYIAVGHIG